MRLNATSPGSAIPALTRRVGRQPHCSRLYIAVRHFSPSGSRGFSCSIVYGIESARVAEAND